MKEIYLDAAATFPVYPEVAGEMEKIYLNNYGNPSSLHARGEDARKILEIARKRIAAIIGARAHEIIFTSGGTESDNLALQGVARTFPKKKKVVISAIEHPAVSETAGFLSSCGFGILKIGVDNEGILNYAQLESELEKNSEKIALVSVMHVNNIIGVVQDIKKIGALCRKHGVLFHTDAVQSFGKLSINVRNSNIDLLSASAHKIGGPAGVGILFVRDGIRIAPQIFGGGQEKNLRSGTENVAAIAGFAKASELHLKENKIKILETRDALMREMEKLGGIVNGSGSSRIYNNIHVTFPGADAESLVFFLSQNRIYVSTGSACDSKKETDDHVLKALGVKKILMRNSVRITLTKELSGKEINFVINTLRKFLRK